MRGIFRRITKMKDGTGKDFLLKSFYSAKKYITAEDEQSLQVVISRLNGLYQGMSKEGQEISVALVNAIMEAIGKV